MPDINNLLITYMTKLKPVAIGWLVESKLVVLKSMGASLLLLISHSGSADTLFKLDIDKCGDEAVITAYNYGVTDPRFLSEYQQDSIVVAKWIMTGDHNVDGLPKIAKDTPYIEPCYYFTAGKLGLLDKTPRYKDLAEKNQALAYFKQGLSRYFARWVTHNYEGSSVNATERDVAINFHRTLLTITNTQENTYRLFRSSNRREKKRYLWNIYNHLLSNDDTADRNLSSWTILLITSHYKRLNMEKDLYAFREYLIKPLVSDDAHAGEPFNAVLFTDDAMAYFGIDK